MQPGHRKIAKPSKVNVFHGKLSSEGMFTDVFHGKLNSEGMFTDVFHGKLSSEGMFMAGI